MPKALLFCFHLFVSLFSKQGYKAPFLEPQEHARMKDLKILVLMVALKPLYDLSQPVSYQKLFVLVSHVFSLFSKKGYTAPFLGPQDHARMKDLKIRVLMVALKPLYDFSRPISYQMFVLNVLSETLAKNMHFL